MALTVGDYVEFNEFGPVRWDSDSEWGPGSWWTYPNIHILSCWWNWLVTCGSFVTTSEDHAKIACEEFHGLEYKLKYEAPEGGRKLWIVYRLGSEVWNDSAQ